MNKRPIVQFVGVATLKHLPKALVHWGGMQMLVPHFRLKVGQSGAVTGTPKLTFPIILF
jgi:hypothetical protein